jgi:hypothetical protein
MVDAPGRIQVGRAALGITRSDFMCSPLYTSCPYDIRSVPVMVESQRQHPVSAKLTAYCINFHASITQNRHLVTGCSALPTKEG